MMWCWPLCVCRIAYIEIVGHTIPLVHIVSTLTPKCSLYLYSNAPLPLPSPFLLVFYCLVPIGSWVCAPLTPFSRFKIKTIAKGIKICRPKSIPFRLVYIHMICMLCMALCVCVFVCHLVWVSVLLFRRFLSSDFGFQNFTELSANWHFK